MKNENRSVSIISLSFTLAFIACLFCATAIRLKSAEMQNEDIEYQKKYVYVEVTSYIPSTNVSTHESTLYIAKEYLGQIGIFDTEGRLLDTIEIYTKTLPKADRILLKEGIRLSSKKELEALIEDYSS